MIDQCRHCTAYGNFETCVSVDCYMHVSWYAMELKKLFGQMTAQRDAAVKDAGNAWAEVESLKNETARYESALSEEHSCAYLWSIRCKQLEADLADAQSHVRRLVAENQRLERVIERLTGAPDGVEGDVPNNVLSGGGEREKRHE